MKIKRTLIFAFIFLCIGNSNAQPFGANGATWHYNFGTWTPPYSIVPVVVNSSLPFLIGTDTCRMIGFSGGSGCAAMNSYIVTQRNDSVLYFSQIHNDFVLLYNYNAMIGDTQIIYAPGPGGLDTNVQLLVTDTGSININGYIKRTYTTSQLSFYFSFGGMIIEDIGSTGFPFPQMGFCDPLMGNIRCYEDSIVGLYNFNPAIACDSILNVGIPELNPGEGILCFPNPFNSHLTIFSDGMNTPGRKIIISDLLGRIIKSFYFEYSSNISGITIDLKDLNNGIYLLEVFHQNSHQVQRIIKN